MNSGVLSLVLAFAMHHSIAGVYDKTRQVTIEGVVAEFHFVNPHPFILVDVKNERWKLEPASSLPRQVNIGVHLALKNVERHGSGVEHHIVKLRE